jgi:hypothetical protein
MESPRFLVAPPEWIKTAPFEPLQVVESSKESVPLFNKNDRAEGALPQAHRCWRPGPK